MRRLLFMFFWATLLNHAVAQDALVTERWFTSSTDSFTVFSQLSSRQTERRSMELEQWRNASLQLLDVLNPQVQPAITTYLYIFSNDDDYVLFSDGGEPAYFFSSPRANFIIMQDSDNGLKLAKHHYAHFLLNNRTQGLPRWYEEGMSHYLSRIEVLRNDVVLQRFNEEEFQLILALNDNIELDELFYDDAALASPRLVQIANLKSAFFMHYLLHAHEFQGFNSRSSVVHNYLTQIDQGRTERFAFDQSFEFSMRRLARDFERFLEAGAQRSERDRELFKLAAIDDIEVQPVSIDDKRLWLAELSLHAARFPLAAYLFNALIEEGQAPGRAYSGYADAVRMHDMQNEALELVDEPTIVQLYEQAIERSPQDHQVYLDFGQYYDSKRNNCEPMPSADERLFYESQMQEYFQQALALNPESAEVNLSAAQIYLFDQQNWLTGVPLQEKAFALLASDTFVQEQAVEYALRAEDFDHAQTIIARMARPMHFYGAPDWVAELRLKLRAAQRGESFDACANAN